MSYGKLRSKSMPEHGKVKRPNEDARFLSTPKATSGREPAEHGKKVNYTSETDKAKSARDTLGSLENGGSLVRRTENKRFDQAHEEMHAGRVLGEGVMHPFSKGKK